LDVLVLAQDGSGLDCAGSLDSRSLCRILYH